MTDLKTPSKRFWSGIALGNYRDIEYALEYGFDPKELSPEGLSYRGTPQTSYQKQILPTGTHALEALLICGETWSNDAYSDNEFRKAWNKLLPLMDKSLFGATLQNGETILLAYSKQASGRQKSNIFQKIINRTPKDLIDFQDDRGNSAAHWCINRYRLENFNALMKAGADPNVRNNKGHNCAFAAALLPVSSNRSFAHPKIFLDAAIKAGARIELADNDGNTLPFVFRSTVRIPLKTFVEHGGDVNARGKDGKSLAQALIEKDNLQCLVELCKLPQTDLRSQNGTDGNLLKALLEKRTVSHLNKSDRNILNVLTSEIQALDIAHATKAIDQSQGVSSRRVRL